MGETSNGRNTDTVIALRFKANFIGEKKNCLEVVSGLCPSSLDVEFLQGIGRWLFNEPTVHNQGVWRLVFIFRSKGKKKKSPEVLVFRKNHTLVCQGDRALLDFPVFSCPPHLLPPLIRIYK